METKPEASSWQREAELVREVQRAVDALLTAHATNDVEGYLEAFAERARIVLSSEPAALPSRAAFAEILADHTHVETCFTWDRHIMLINTGAALASHVLSTHFAGVPEPVREHETLVLRRSPTAVWRIVSLHRSRLLLDWVG
jgi:hypothetical protein